MCKLCDQISSEAFAMFVSEWLRGYFIHKHQDLIKGFAMESRSIDFIEYVREQGIDIRMMKDPVSEQGTLITTILKNEIPIYSLVLSEEVEYIGVQIMNHQREEEGCEI